METFKESREYLSAEELRILKALNADWGNFIDNAKRAGLHVNTYRYIIKKGRGSRRNVNKIRSFLLMNPSDESHTSESLGHN